MASTVYFLGAGLSKSLEIPGKPIPLMFDFVSVMAEYLHDDVILATLATMEMAELYDWRSDDALRIVKANPSKVTQWKPPVRSEFRRALKDRPSESIENLLERAFEFSSAGKANSDAQQLSQRFRSAINRLFYLIGSDVNWSPLEKFLKEQFQGGGRHTFVSFNYDLLLDRAVQKQAGDWNVEAGYGFSPKYSYDGSTARDLPQPEGPSRVTVLKPHGSLNWLVPEKHPAGSGFEDGPVTVIAAPSGEISYFKSDNFNWDLFPVCGDAPVGLYIVPPVGAEKSQSQLFIKEVRKREEEAIVEADEVYLIGWSLPKTDKDQEALVKCSVSRRPHPIRSMTVVNHGAEPAYFRRVGDVFGVGISSMRIHNDGFRAFVEGSRTKSERNANDVDAGV
jgi:hypothetical protein